MARIVLLWLPMILLAFANATLREVVLTKHFNALRAHQVSTVTLMLLCAIYCACIFPVLHINSYKQALGVGFAWVVLTVLFEFALGLLLKRSWSQLLQQYDVTAGQIWPLFLLFLGLLPVLLWLIRR